MTECKETYSKDTSDQLLIKELRELIKGKEAQISALKLHNAVLEIELSQMKRYMQND